MYAWDGRLGQKRDVVIYKLSIANSVEERILALQVSVTLCAHSVDFVKLMIDPNDRRRSGR